MLFKQQFLFGELIEMGIAKYIQDIFKKEWKGLDNDYKSLMQKRTIEYRKDKRAIVKVEKPTNLTSAKQVGYKAKQGIFVARVRVRKGSGTYKRPKSKRRPKRQGQSKLTRKINTRSMAEQKASNKFSNAEVIGSYKIAEDGKSHYYEIVLADREGMRIGTDPKLVFVTDQKGRAERGKTIAGRRNKKENQKRKKKTKNKKKAQKKRNSSK
jgi:large subunit ribosomal protein L15e